MELSIHNLKKNPYIFEKEIHDIFIIVSKSKFIHFS